MSGNLGAVRSLLAHPAFAMSNPNMCYSMFLSFLRSTPTFHAADGSGYEFLADSILQARAQALFRALVMSAGGLLRCDPRSCLAMLCPQGHMEWPSVE